MINNYVVEQPMLKKRWRCVCLSRFHSVLTEEPASITTSMAKYCVINGFLKAKINVLISEEFFFLESVEMYY